MISYLIASLMRVFTIIAVLLLILWLVPLVGPFVVQNLPAFADMVGQILNALWNGLQRLLYSF